MEIYVATDTYQFDKDERAQFIAGSLRQTWFEMYPQLFDTNDYHIAINQPRYHFYEWFAAIQLYQTTGWLSLNQQYQYRNHPTKRAVLARLNSALLFSAVDGSRQGQCPDLLAYLPDYSDWKFYEVKGPGDRIRVGSNQETRFRTIVELTGEPIRMIHVVEKKAMA
jgi:hypothetical protein